MFQMNSLKTFSVAQLPSLIAPLRIVLHWWMSLTGWWLELDPVLPGGSALRRAVGPGLALIRSQNFHQQRPRLCLRCSVAAENHVLLSGASPQPRLCLLRDSNCSLQRCYSWGLLFFPQQRPSVPALSVCRGVMPAHESAPLATVPSKSFRYFVHQPLFSPAQLASSTGLVHHTARTERFPLLRVSDSEGRGDGQPSTACD